ncbi:MAG: acyl-CoA dehydrogenase family protein [Methylocella sp.]
MSAPPDLESKAEALARDFARRAAEHDEAGSFPFENFELLHKAGLLALIVPSALGGGGGDLSAANHVVNAIGAGEPSTALVLAQQYLFHFRMLRHPAFPPALKEEIARSALMDGALCNALLVEPEQGSPIRGGLPATTARRVEGGFRLSGRKIYSTGSVALRWLAVWARTDDSEPLLGGFIIAGGAEGLSIEETWNHLGMRASASHDMIFDDVFVPAAHAVDLRAPADLEPPDAAATAWIAILFSTIYDGVARAARDWLVGFLRERAPSNLGAPLATLPRMQDAIGAIDALLYVNRALLADIAGRCDAGAPPPARESQFMKLAVTNNAVEAVAKALEVSGNPGLSRRNALQRHYRDVLCARVHSPQDDAIRLAGGREALSLPPISR